VEINWLGATCFRIRSRDEATILTDPYSAEGGLPRGAQADIVTVSDPEALSRLPVVASAHAGEQGRAEPMVVVNPGEYEVRDVLMTVLRSYRDDVKGEELGRNMIFRIETEGMTLCHLGEIGHKPTSEQVEALGRVDILLIPVATPGGLTPAKAAEIVNLIGPKVVVPMTVAGGDDEHLAQFLKEMGAPEAQPQPRLTIARNALPEVTTVALLEGRRQAPV
jgi:L-ascorbate metabolism protein UlaG (beta-lactamase superfamily)